MLDVEQLLELAQELADPSGAGAPRQVVLRRAVSTAYYAAFHALCGHAAGTFVTGGLRKSRALFYRSLEHGKSKDRCKRLGQNPLPGVERKFFAIPSFAQELRSFANTFVLLQEMRHRSDYDPDYKIAKAEAQEAVDDARQAMADLQSANPDQRNMFLAYVLFGLRAP